MADEAVYNALPVGEYRFEVRVMDRDGLLSEVASVEIQILPDAKTERIHAFENVLRATDHVVHSESRAMRQVMKQTVRVAETAMTVLVLGETGTGKGLLAQTIHETSSRRKRPFIQVNCGALPAGLVESELFGHEKGAFTGAASRQLGRFELADGGTLFLDEIGDLPLESQRVLLHILEENALTRVGGKQPVSVDVRVIANFWHGMCIYLLSSVPYHNLMQDARSHIMNYRSLLIACLATLGLAVAGWGQADGKIAFTSWREGAGDVWIMNADGSNPVNLTQGRHGLCVSLTWSPDGTKIAYFAFSFSDDSGSDDVIWVDYSVTDIWVMDADGGNAQQVGYIVKPGVRYLLEPALEVLFWAEDGSSIYYYVPSRSELFVVPLDGSGSSLMDWREAAWIVRPPFLDNLVRSPDGTKLADVVLQDPEGNAYLRLYSYAPSEGPQPSDQLEDFREILLPDLPYQQEGLEPGFYSSAYPAPTWSPDSMKIAFSAANEQGYEEVWVVDIDGSNLVNLTNGLGGDYPAWQPVSPSAATSVEAQSWGRIKALHSTGSR